MHLCLKTLHFIVFMSLIYQNVNFLFLLLATKSSLCLHYRYMIIF